MNLKIYAVRDNATEQFGNPMFMVSNGQALRSFTDEVNNKESTNLLHKHPEDYELYEIGEYDTDTGEFQTHKPTRIAQAKDMVIKQ